LSGLGNQFLANIREVSVILHVVRCYEDENITHVENTIDPIRDIETIELELMLSDLEALEKTKNKKGSNKDLNLQLRSKLIERTIAGRF
jgi:ribosome-binding ATPase YchF (GTP1/OBG family)